MVVQLDETDLTFRIISCIIVQVIIVKQQDHHQTCVTTQSNNLQYVGTWLIPSEIVIKL